jgi:ribosomal protein S11
MKLKKKENFNFGEVGACRIHIRRAYTNIYITLTDLNDQVIVCHTSGSSDKAHSKRRKRAAQTVELIFRNVIPYIRLYKLLNVELVVKMKMSAVFHTLIKELAYYNLNVINIKLRRAIAHNGVRGKKLRRR